ncbi:MAG: hypothetical protein RI922_2436 [Bacteroidota bacterium]|jgi:hypothetical protein
MKPFLTFITCIFSYCGFSQLTYIPDDGFEQYLESTYPSVNNGAVNDNYILSSGIPNIITIQLSGMFGNSVSDFTGIGSLTSLLNVQIMNMTMTNIDLSSIENNWVNPVGYMIVSVEYCNNLTNISLPKNKIRLTLSNNPVLENIQFHPTNVFYSINGIQDNNSITTINLSNTSGVNPGAQLWVSGNTNLQCLSINNGECSNWSGVLTMPNGTTNATSPGGTLYCVQVDNPAYSEIAGNWSFSSANIPSTYYYSTNCGCVASIDEEILDEVTISPNPTTSKFVVEGMVDMTGTNYYLLDQIGNMIHSGTFDAENKEIDLSRFAEGVYWLKFDNSLLPVQKIIKQ